MRTITPPSAAPAALLAAAALALASGCRTPTPSATPAERSGVAALAAAAPGASTRAAVPYPDTGWLADFARPELDALVAEALAHNLDLQAAAARLDGAAAAARAAGASLQPALALGLDAGRGGRFEGGSSAASFGAGLNFSWEVDLWGRLRAQRSAALADFAASRETLAAARQSLAAQVAKTWFSALEADALAGFTAAIHAAYVEQLRIIRAQVDAGLAEKQNLSLLETAAAQAEDGALQAAHARAETLRGLELLLGRYPSAAFALDAAKLAPPPPVPPGLPADILERRADLRAAEAQVSAAFFRTAEADAARLPAITLTGSLGGGSTDLGQLLRPDNLAWSLGAGLLGPIFDGGRREAVLDQADAAQRAAIATYGQKALVAFREVESSLATETLLTARQVAATQAATSAAEALRIAQARYDVGAEDMLALLQIRRQHESARITAVSLGYERLRARVDLHLALGGSFAPQP
jgi:NodT family efflux transporter outer membrane factor (OMF) lipoprotein